MAAHGFFTSINDWATGDLVAVDENTGYAVHYDSTNPLPVVGAAIIPDGSGNSFNGRQYYCINGSPYYLNDTYIWDEKLTSDFITTNPAYAPFNPLGDAGYITAITTGIAAIKKSITTGVPTAWIRIHIGSIYDWYLIR